VPPLVPAVRKWRFRAALLCGLLLPAPLVWLLGLVLYEGGSPLVTTEGVTVVPMLTHEEHRERQTFEQPCQQDDDCEPPLVCFFNMRRVEHYCSDSTCMTDTQCPEGFACRAVRHGEDTVVRTCSLLGKRLEGERCEAMPLTPEGGCARGLLCAGTCGRPCQPDESESCPEGLFCAPAPTGAVCRPTCESRGCPEGQECVRLSRGASACMVVHGTNCQRTPCADARECRTWAPASQAGHVWMSCVIPCSHLKPDCPEGLVCHRAQCRQPCAPGEPDACAHGQECTRAHEGEPWLCRTQHGDP
jgi:hypothetical protein